MKPLWHAAYGGHWWSAKVGGTHPFALNKGWPWDEGQWFVQWWTGRYRFCWRIWWQEWIGFHFDRVPNVHWNLSCGWFCISRMNMNQRTWPAAYRAARPEEPKND